MKLSLDAFMQKANLTSIEDLKNSIKGGNLEDCHVGLTKDLSVKTMGGTPLELKAIKTKGVERFVSSRESFFNNQFNLA